MRGTVAKRISRAVIAAHPGQGSRLVAVEVTRGPARMRKLTLQRRAQVSALVGRGMQRHHAEELVPTVRPTALQARTEGPRAAYRAAKRAYTRS